MSQNFDADQFILNVRLSSWWNSVLFLQGRQAHHPLEKLKPLFIQQVVLSQLADCVLQSHQFVHMAAVSLLQHFHFLLQLQHNHLQLLLTQAVLVVAVGVRIKNDESCFRARGEKT